MAKRYLTMKDIQKMQEAYQSASDSALFVLIVGGIVVMLLLVAFSIIKFMKWVLRSLPGLLRGSLKGKEPLYLP